MEIKIAICDDEHQQTEYIKMLVNKWANENNINIKIEMFDSAENFKSAWSDNKNYSSCRFCDDIAVFHEGELIQRGSHETLIADENGKYHELWNAQAQYYTENKETNIHDII